MAAAFVWPDDDGDVSANACADAAAQWPVPPPGTPLDHIKAAAAAVFVAVARLLPAYADLPRDIEAHAALVAAADYDALLAAAMPKQALWLRALMRDAGLLDAETRATLARVQGGAVPSQAVYDFVVAEHMAWQLCMAVDLAYPDAELEPLAAHRFIGVSADCPYVGARLAAWRPPLGPVRPADDPELARLRADADRVVDALREITHEVGRLANPFGHLRASAVADGLVL